MSAPRFPGSSDSTVRSPSRHDLAQAIRRLDGEEFHDVYLTRRPVLDSSGHPTAFLGIHGGPERYAVIVIEHEQFALIVNIHDPSETWEEVMCGGQQSSFICSHLVGFQAALAAAVHYADTGEASPMLS